MAEGWEYEEDAGREERESGSGLPAFASDPIGILRRRWIWMVLGLAIGIGATAGIAMQLDPTYLAETTILISSQMIPEEFVRTTVREDSLSHINAIVGQALSRQNLAELVNRYSLYAAERDREQLATVIAHMRTNIEIYPQQTLKDMRRRETSSQVFVISFEYRDADIAATVANELGGLFTEANIAMRNRQAQLTTNFLRRELERAERELREQEGLITAFLQKHRGSLPGELNANIAKLERLQRQRQSLAAQVDTAESRILALRQRPEPGNVGPTPQTLLSELKARLEEQLVILTEEHPNIIALQRRIERLEAHVTIEETSPATTSERGILLAAEKRQLELLRGQVASTAEAIGALDVQVGNTPMRQEELAALEQRVTVLRENYLQFLRKVQEAELAQSLESAQHGARISVLDRAAPPPRPQLPRWKIFVGGIAASLVLSIGLAILLELLDTVIVNTDQLELLVEKPLLGSVPRVA